MKQRRQKKGANYEDQLKEQNVLMREAVPQWSEFEGDFRAFEAKFEAALDRCYSSDKPPYDTLASDDSDCLDPFFLATTERLLDALLKTREELVDKWLYGDLDGRYFKPWEHLTVERREEVLLEALEELHRWYESQGPSIDRIEAPELTLALAKDPKALRELCQAIVFGSALSAVDPRQRLFPLVRDKRWDRAYRQGEFSRPVPQNRQSRSHVQRALFDRHMYLSRFMGVICRKIRGEPEPAMTLLSIPVSLNEKTTSTLLPSASEQRKAGLIDRMAKMSKVCLSCGAEATSGVKLLVCARCKPLGRDVHYCSKDCQAKDFSSHKAVCGKDFESVAFPLPPIEPEFPKLTPKREFVCNHLCLSPSAVWLFPFGEHVHIIELDERVPDSRRINLLASLRKIVFEALTSPDPVCVGAVFLLLDSNPCGSPHERIKHQLVIFAELHAFSVFGVMASDEALRLREGTKARIGEWERAGASPDSCWMLFKEYYELCAEQAELSQPRAEDDTTPGKDDETLSWMLTAGMFGLSMEDGADYGDFAVHEAIEAPPTLSRTQKRNRRKRQKRKEERGEHDEAAEGAVEVLAKGFEALNAQD
ncbi:hypothetical protein JCM6882_006165 [Rhodosporidiobolus microsporus]